MLRGCICCVATGLFQAHGTLAVGGDLETLLFGKPRIVAHDCDVLGARAGAMKAVSSTKCGPDGPLDIEEAGDRLMELEDGQSGGYPSPTQVIKEGCGGGSKFGKDAERLGLGID